MKKLMKQAWNHTLAGLLMLVLASTVSAQQTPSKSLGAPTPPRTTDPVLSSPTTSAPQGLPIELPEPPAAESPTTTLPGIDPLRLREPSPSVLPNRRFVSTQDPPIMSSQPPPFTIDPNAPPTATNDPNFYQGNPPVQDLSGLVAGNFRNTKYKWYGFVRLDGIYDFRPMDSTDSFVTSSLPIPQGRGQNAVLTPRYTRLGFDTETPIESLDWTIKTRIEMDFFNGNTSGLFGSFPIRLRFAWADFGPFLIGQAASLFMDYDVFPNVIDYQGPGGMVLMRQPLIGVHVPFGENCKFSIAVEQPYSDIQWLENGEWIVNPGSGIISTPGVPRNVQDVPDLTGNVRYVGDYGHVQVAGIARKLTFQPATGDSALDELGYGINVTGTLHPWALIQGTPKSGDCATPLSKSRFLAQFAAGRGINRYIQDVNGLGLDATFDPINGFRAIPSYGWFIAYEQWWLDNLISNFTYGQNSCDLTDSLPNNTYKGANYVTANLIYLPVERMGVGLEFLYGTRKNKDGLKAENTRIQMAFQYRF